MSENFFMQLHNVTQQYTKKSEHNSKQLYNIVELHDITTPNTITNQRIFTKATASPIEQITKSNKMKTIKTHERFYYDGIISSSFFTDRNLCKMKEKEYEFSQVLCNKNWLLVHVIFSQFCHKHVFDLKNIDIINIGNSDGGIISGIHYYLNFSNLAKTTKLNHASNAIKNISWLCMDKNLNLSNKNFSKFKLYYNAISRTHNISKHIIHGFANDDICNYANYKFAKTQLFNNTTPNIIFNTLASEETHKYKPILISLSLATNVKEHTLIATKLLHPSKWDNIYEKYIALISNMFSETYLMAYPVCENKLAYYEYYIISYGVPKLLYLDKLRRRFEYINSSDPLLFDIIDDVLDVDVLEKIKTFKTKKIKSPLSSLHEIIDNLKDII